MNLLIHFIIYSKFFLLYISNCHRISFAHGEKYKFFIRTENHDRSGVSSQRSRKLLVSLNTSPPTGMPTGEHNIITAFPTRGN